MANRPMPEARRASPIHASNQNSLDGSRAVRKAVSNALTPIRTPPQPGTAVKAPARSMVSRMKRKLSNACSWMETTFGDFDCCCAELMSRKVIGGTGTCQVLCNIKKTRNCERRIGGTYLAQNGGSQPRSG